MHLMRISSVYQMRSGGGGKGGTSGRFSSVEQVFVATVVVVYWHDYQ